MFSEEKEPSGNQLVLDEKFNEIRLYLDQGNHVLVKRLVLCLKHSECDIDHKRQLKDILVRLVRLEASQSEKFICTDSGPEIFSISFESFVCDFLEKNELIDFYLELSKTIYEKFSRFKSTSIVYLDYALKYFFKANSIMEKIDHESQFLLDLELAYFIELLELRRKNDARQVFFENNCSIFIKQLYDIRKSYVDLLRKNGFLEEKLKTIRSDYHASMIRLTSNIANEALRRYRLFSPSFPHSFDFNIIGIGSYAMSLGTLYSDMDIVVFVSREIEFGERESVKNFLKVFISLIKFLGEEQLATSPTGRKGGYYTDSDDEKFLLGSADDDCPVIDMPEVFVEKIVSRSDPFDNRINAMLNVTQFFSSQSFLSGNEENTLIERYKTALSACTKTDDYAYVSGLNRLSRDVTQHLEEKYTVFMKTLGMLYWVNKIPDEINKIIFKEFLIRPIQNWLKNISLILGVEWSNVDDLFTAFRDTGLFEENFLKKMSNAIDILWAIKVRLEADGCFIADEVLLHDLSPYAEQLNTIITSIIFPILHSIELMSTFVDLYIRLARSEQSKTDLNRALKGVFNDNLSLTKRVFSTFFFTALEKIQDLQLEHLPDLFFSNQAKEKLDADLLRSFIKTGSVHEVIRDPFLLIQSAYDSGVYSYENHTGVDIIALFFPELERHYRLAFNSDCSPADRRRSMETIPILESTLISSCFNLFPKKNRVKQSIRHALSLGSDTDTVSLDSQRSHPVSTSNSENPELDPELSEDAVNERPDDSPLNELAGSKETSSESPFLLHHDLQCLELNTTHVPSVLDDHSNSLLNVNLPLNRVGLLHEIVMKLNTENLTPDDERLTLIDPELLAFKMPDNYGQTLSHLFFRSASVSLFNRIFLGYDQEILKQLSSLKNEQHGPHKAETPLHFLCRYNRPLLLNILENQLFCSAMNDVFFTQNASGESPFDILLNNSEEEFRIDFIRKMTFHTHDVFLLNILKYFQSIGDQYNMPSFLWLHSAIENIFLDFSDRLLQQNILHYIAGNKNGLWCITSLHLLKEHFPVILKNLLHKSDFYGWTPLRRFFCNDEKPWDNEILSIFDPVFLSDKEEDIYSRETKDSALSLIAENKFKVWNEQTIRIVLEKKIVPFQSIVYQNIQFESPLYCVLANRCKRWDLGTLKFLFSLQYDEASAQSIRLDSYNLMCVFLDNIDIWEIEAFEFLLVFFNHLSINIVTIRHFMLQSTILHHWVCKPSVRISFMLDMIAFILINIPKNDVSHFILAKDSEGKTALEYSVIHQKSEVLKLLIDALPDDVYNEYKGSKEIRSLLILANEKNDKVIYRYLSDVINGNARLLNRVLPDNISHFGFSRNTEAMPFDRQINNRG